VLKEHNLERSWIVVGSAILLLLYAEFGLPSYGYVFDLVKLLATALLSLFVIIKSSDYAVTALSHYAKKTGVSEYLIGFVVVSIGTSLPDISNTIFSTLQHNSSFVIGNVLGANVLDVTLVIGLTALVARKIKIRKNDVRSTFVNVWIAILFVLVLGLDGRFSRFDGMIFLLFFLAYIGFHVRKELKYSKLKANVEWRHIWKHMVVFIGTLLSLLLASRWFVFSSMVLAKEAGISNFIMGIFFVALGTTIPELTVGVHAALKNLHHIGLGNSLGSMVVNFGLVLGIGAIMAPINFQIIGFLVAIGVMAGGLLALQIYARDFVLTWKHGLFLCAFYAIFVFVEFVVV